MNLKTKSRINKISLMSLLAILMTFHITESNQTNLSFFSNQARYLDTEPTSPSTIEAHRSSNSAIDSMLMDYTKNFLAIAPPKSGNNLYIYSKEKGK